MPDGQPQIVNVDAKSEQPRPPQWDPTQGPFWVRTLINTTFAGAVLFLFTLSYMRQAEQAEKIIEKMQVMLDKQEDRRTKEQEREIARTDKIHDANEARLREWNKTAGERQALEADKLRLEMKALSENVKLLTDRVRLQTMKD